MYGFHMELPVPQSHWMKILGNISAVSLVIGCVWLLIHRMDKSKAAGNATAFDNFFLGVVILLTVTGILTELGRYFFVPHVAIGIYI